MLTIIVLIICTLYICYFPLKVNGNTEENNQTIYYAVCEGDTIWSIAQTYFEASGYADIREFVYYITKTNDKQNDYIHVGETLEIPLWD